jgi:malonate decarboxylase delta subunit
MEHLTFQLHSQPAEQTQSLKGDVLCGIVSSGNLEILVERVSMEPNTTQDLCMVTVDTAAEGFGETWQAVLTQFAETHPVGGLHFSLNDVGATPAVVALRMAQAYEEWRVAMGVGQ